MAILQQRKDVNTSTMCKVYDFEEDSYCTVS
jgi:hypothetical protein